MWHLNPIIIDMWQCHLKLLLTSFQQGYDSFLLIKAMNILFLYVWMTHTDKQFTGGSEDWGERLIDLKLWVYPEQYICSVT